MLTRSDRFDAALRYPHSAVTNAAVTIPGQDPVPLLVSTGNVASTADHGVRRTLTLEVANTGVEWAALQPAGATIYVVRGVNYPDGGQEHVSLGRFRVDDAQITYTDNQSISITGPDQWAIIQDRLFEVTTKPTRSTYVEEILELLSVVDSGTPRVTATGDIPLPTKGIVYTQSREDAIYSLAQVIGADVAFAADGVAEIRDLPTVKTDPVWEMGSSPAGVLSTAVYDTTRADTYNVIVVTSTATTGKHTFAQVVVEDDDPSSPTWVGGPFGRRPRFISSDLIRTAAQALHVAQCQLAQTTGLHSQLTLGAGEQPALEVFDSVSVGFPPRPGIASFVERHIVDTITFALDGSAQQITTRAIGAAESPTGAVLG